MEADGLLKLFGILDVLDIRERRDVFSKQFDFKVGYSFPYLVVDSLVAIIGEVDCLKDAQHIRAIINRYHLSSEQHYIRSDNRKSSSILGICLDRELAVNQALLWKISASYSCIIFIHGLSCASMAS